MEALKAETDVIIFDSPPLLATSDAQVLASKVDGVLYVMQLGRVPKSSVARSFELLAQARADVLGIALNKIDYAHLAQQRLRRLLLQRLLRTRR